MHRKSPEGDIRNCQQPYLGSGKERLKGKPLRFYFISYTLQMGLIIYTFLNANFAVGRRYQLRDTLRKSSTETFSQGIIF